MRIKVFIAAYVNQTNSQNLSCRTLIQHLDKSKFEVYTLYINHGNLPKLNDPDVHVFNCFYPVKLTGYLGFMWGIWNCDVCYLAKGNMYKWERRILKFLRRKSFKTVEIVFDETALDTAARIYRDIEVADAFSFVDRRYSLSQHMKTYNFRTHGIQSEDQIVPLVNDTSFFSKFARVRYPLTDVLFLGNDFKRKGIEDFLQVASRFPRLKFHVVGRGDGFSSDQLAKMNQGNVAVHGMLSHDALVSVMDSCQLHVLPSRSEGFPKVIIELATAGIPTVTYNDYGAAEWLTNGIDGFVVADSNEIASVIQMLQDDPEKMRICSQGVLELGKQYSVDKVVKIYEKIIEDLYYEK